MPLTPRRRALSWRRQSADTDRRPGRDHDPRSMAENRFAHITVLFDTRRRHWKQNPYMQMLADSVSAESVPHGFSWRFALLGHYDVFHIHWPEYLLKMQGPARRTAARCLFALLLVRLKLLRTTVVRTRHNRSAHVDVGRLDAFLLTSLQHQVALEIRMNRLDIHPLDGNRALATAHIPHGNYRPYLDSLNGVITGSHPDSEDTRLLAFGILRPYKNFDEIVRALAGVKPRTDVTLTIVGSPADTHYTAALAALVDSVGSRVSLEVGRVDDQELVGRIAASDFVVVPYEDLYSSGVALLSLSLNVPVVLRETDAGRELRDEFGEYWVRSYTGSITPDVIEDLVADHVSTGKRDAVVSWSPEREWQSVGRRTTAEYRRAVELVRSGARSSWRAGTGSSGSRSKPPWSRA